jgi:DNA-binding response OmpR family regulator
MVEDDEAIGQILRIFLEDSGCRVLTATQGQEAVKLAIETRPDLMTLDLALPDIDGHEVLRQLAAEPLTADVPVIVITAHPFQPKNATQVKAVLHKPFDATELERSVRRVLKSASST